VTGASRGPLAGIRVLDLTSVVMGPYATQLLGDYGADVIKVERPDGDVMRQSGPMRNRGMGHLYLTTNRSKRSIAIDLKDNRGRDILLRLCKSADVLVCNLHPQAMARLRLSYEDIRSVNPRIIYMGAFGFSQRGPYAGRPAYDDLIQGMAGTPFLTQIGRSEPRYVPLIFADRTAGLQLALAIASALVHRERHGEGHASTSRCSKDCFRSFLASIWPASCSGLPWVRPVISAASRPTAGCTRPQTDTSASSSIRTSIGGNSSRRSAGRICSRLTRGFPRGATGLQTSMPSMIERNPCHPRQG
jgi:hypothetical protein